MCDVGADALIGPQLCGVTGRAHTVRPYMGKYCRNLALPLGELSVERLTERVKKGPLV